MKAKKIFKAILLTMLLTGCSLDYKDVFKENANSDEVPSDSLSIGYICHEENPEETFYGAYEMAVEDIEKMESPVNIDVKVYYDYRDYTQGLEVAQNLCSDKSMVGAVGYGDTELTFSLKNIYEENKMPLLVPTVASDELISDEKYIYQMSSTVNENSMLLTSYAYTDESINNAVIIYSDDDYADEYSKTLELRLTENKRVAVADKVCKPDVYKDIPECLKKWQALDVDTIFLVGHDISLYQDYVPIINELDSSIKIYCSDDFENYYLDGREAYPYYENVYQCSAVQYDYNDEIADFYERYNEKYGIYPNSDAVQIYDSIMIIAKAIAENDVRTSEQLRNFLNTSESIDSIYGDALYFSDNMMCGKMCFLQRYNEDGTLSYSFSMTNDDLYDVWYNYYPLEMINEFAGTGDYSNEQQ